ncbi:MAG: DUF4136 domain-containing protein [Holophaga sp.]|nr:DUF4136 domain-containing protein [Holophaga sp.]
MRYLRPLLAASAMTLVLACSGPSVQFDYDARTSFSAYQSYAWQQAPPGGRPGQFSNAIVRGRVQRAVEAELGAKGFIQAEDTASPDFLVTYYPLRESSRSQQVHLGLGFGMGPLGMGIAAPVGDPHREAMAGLVLEIQDFRSGSVVWKASTESTFQGSDSPEEADSDVKAAVHNMFKRFPPPGK